ncbi:MAG: signal peptide peptidase-domain-containing protein [Olpidium bornovanus]|uniref:Signal peptide peptidase-domain-containing protein n=1 Tax=Olpidium bornovanus TaxID=278681 RepID=A0A8H7ZVW0_9FUNG|nr:MAG: signal peptide peptidase-domain-containing protein [Olpidium bornovanus]
MTTIDTGTGAAYLALGAMAVVPIYYGSWGSLKGLKSKAAEKVTKGGEYVSSSSEEDSETLRSEDAYWFPVIGSCVLFGTYLIFKFLDPYYFNMLLAAYFSTLGTAALTKVSVATLRGLSGVRPANFKVVVTKRAKGAWESVRWDDCARAICRITDRVCFSRFFEVLGRALLSHAAVYPIAHPLPDLFFCAAAELLTFRFSYLHVAMSIISILFNGYYVYSENWAACNVLGLAFSVNAIQLLALDSFSTGMILLSGLFVYDVFWVFGTEVMVTVARKFNGPIKVVFPRDFAAEKWQFAMLGLGDIVIPGIFVALCLRFDYHLALKRLQNEIPAGAAKHYRFPRPYFTSCFAAYVAGLVVTVVVMHVTQAAQPALLYLSPACILSVLIAGTVRGELKEVWDYSATVKLAEDDKELEEKARQTEEISVSARATGSSQFAAEATRRIVGQNSESAMSARPTAFSTDDDGDASAIAGDTESTSSSPSRKKKKRKPKKFQETGSS